MKTKWEVKLACRPFPSISSQFLSARVEESKAIIANALSKTSDPLVIQFSGGRDSLTMLQLVREVADRFICSYMVSGIDFPESVAFATDMAKNLGVPLYLSHPSDHLGGFFERLERLRCWPTVRKIWCQRDLKVRPQHKMLHKLLGNQPIYKLVAVRKWESSRRRVLYSLDRVIVSDNNTGRDFLVYPIINWTNDDILNYLESRNLPSSGLYKKYGVSGCYWCPFYQPSIYKRILAGEPHFLEPFIQAEERYGPSVSGHRYLRDLRNEVMVLAS